MNKKLDYTSNDFLYNNYLSVTDLNQNKGKHFVEDKSKKHNTNNQ